MLYLKTTPRDFSWVKWSPKDIKSIGEKIIKIQKETHQKIKTLKPKERTFKNTFEALEMARGEYLSLFFKVYLLLNVSPDETLRRTASKVVDEISKKQIGLELDPTLYEILRGVGTKEKKLKPEEKRLVETTLRDYCRLGVTLSPAKRKTLKKLLERLTLLEARFRKNINEYYDALPVKRSELEGLPDSYIERLKRDSRDHYLVTLDYPDIIPFMELAKNEPARIRLYQKNLRKGGKENMKVLKEIVTLRFKRAALLGYAHPADFEAEIGIVKQAKRALTFLRSLASKIQPKVQKELKELEDLKRKETGNKRAHLGSWDTAYYSRLYRERQGGFDFEVVRQYFPLKEIKQKLFDFYGKLLGVTIKRVNLPVWDKEVEWYEVGDEKGPRAYFALDLFPRPAKYGHAAAFELTFGYELNHKYIPPVSGLVTNFSPASSASPSLLTFEEVRTFFHEFGHIMHQTLTTARFPSQSGTNVPRDFVEAPSQMFEYWLEDEKVVTALSSHFKNKATLPKSLAHKLTESKKLLLGHRTIRQIVFGLFDLELHHKKGIDPVKLYSQLVKKHCHFTVPQGALFAASFGHLVGYAAGYYSYLWSKAYAAQMFSVFRRRGLDSAVLGRKYRRLILEPGSSFDLEDQVRRFLGKKLDQKELLKDLGVGQVNSPKKPKNPKLAKRLKRKFPKKSAGRRLKKR